MRVRKLIVLTAVMALPAMVYAQTGSKGNDGKVQPSGTTTGTTLQKPGGNRGNATRPVNSTTNTTAVKPGGKGNTTKNPGTGTSRPINGTTSATSGKDNGTTTLKNPGNGQTVTPQNITDWSQAQQTAQPFIQQKPNGNINWTDQYVEAKGQAVIDTEKFKNPAQAKLMANRGAVVVAQRNLLEIIKGVNVTGETTVEDMITTKDYIYTRVDGVIKGAQTIGEPIVKDGYIEVRMRVPLYERNGLAPALYSDIPAFQKSAVAGQGGDSDNGMGGRTPGSGSSQAGSPGGGTAGDYNPLLFNITNPQSWNPSMFPLVTDESGNVVMDMSKIYDPTKGKFPQVLGLTKDIFDAAGWKKGADAIDAVAQPDGKLVIPNSQKGKINWGKVLNTVADIGRFVIRLF